MKLVTFTYKGRTRIGAIRDEEVVDLVRADAGIPADMLSFLCAGEAAMEAARTVLGQVSSPVLALADVRLEAPVMKPPKFLGVGLNYTDHAAETGRTLPEFPVFFNKQSTCVIGPDQGIILPCESSQVDYEGELGFVIGRPCRRVARGRAADVIAGYLVVNDVSARDWQVRAPTMTLGKSFDTHGPIGPWIVTADEVGNPHALGIRTWVNEELRQQSNTCELVFDCFALVEILSTVFTLEPGDIVSTGTPAGVGMAADPPRFLRAGDVVRIEIERIGTLRNPVVGEE